MNFNDELTQLEEALYDARKKMGEGMNEGMNLSDFKDAQTALEKAEYNLSRYLLNDPQDDWEQEMRS